MVTLYCHETPNLKLGPGIRAGDPDVVVFRDGYAEIDPTDPLFTVKMSWLRHPGTPHVRILDGDEAKSAEEEVEVCEECSKDGIVKAFPTEKALNGHILGAHHRKG